YAVFCLKKKNNRLTYLKFDLTSVTTINSAKLQLFGQLSNSVQNNIGVAVYGADDTTWSETGITWNNKPAITTGPLATTTILNATPGLYTWDLTTYLRAQKAAGHNSVTLVLKATSTSDPRVI